jgi:hypothetical protein
MLIFNFVRTAVQSARGGRITADRGEYKIAAFFSAILQNIEYI